MPDEVRHRLASLRRDPSSGRNDATTAASSASVVGGSITPSRRATSAVCATYSSRPAWSSGLAP